MVVKRRTNTKNPPIFSHEFVIQNHADIVACVAMVFVLGLMFQVTSPLASLFIALQHNATVAVPVPGGQGATQDFTFYTAGLKDIPAVFFYLLIAIVMHQIVQEYLLDKVNRKLHLSKIKHAKFNESGQLLTFYLVSAIWAGDIVFRENIFSLRQLWEDYPHVHMTFMFKFFFIVQLAYWLHVFPELYFQKVKREDMRPRVQYACLYLAYIAGAYVFSYTRLCLVLLLLQYVVEALFHMCRLIAYTEKDHQGGGSLASLYNALFVVVRLGSISLAVLTFWYGLALIPADQQTIDVAAGNFNTPVFRFQMLLLVCMLQAYLMWNFITFQLRRRREASQFGGDKSSSSQRKKTHQEKSKARKEQKAQRRVEDEDESLPEVDQNTKKTLRQRK